MMATAMPYDDLIMEHIRNARNYRALDDASHRADGSNPLCGDELTVYLKIERERISDVAFQCMCCGITMASASIMTESVMGKPAADARILLRTFVAALNDRADRVSRDADPVLRAILATVRELPVRASCAALPWVTLEAALDNRQDVVFVR